jgi:hypothetical protein
VKQPTIDLVLFHDRQASPERFYVSIVIGTRELDLCRFTDVGEAAAYMAKYIATRGYEWARDSARRVDAAQRSDACTLRLTAVPTPS